MPNNNLPFYVIFIFYYRQGIYNDTLLQMLHTFYNYQTVLATCKRLYRHYSWIVVVDIESRK